MRCGTAVASARFEERRARQSAAFGSANREAQLRDLREARSSLAESTCAQTAHSSFMESMERRMKGSCLRTAIPNIRLRSRSILRTRSRRLESRCFGAGTRPHNAVAGQRVATLTSSDYTGK
jgi:hypothetical protein